MLDDDRDEDSEEEPSSSESEYSNGCQSMFEFRCKEALLLIFTEDLGCTADEAKAHARRFSIAAMSARYEGDDNLHEIECQVTVDSFEEGSTDTVTLYFESCASAGYDDCDFSSTMECKLGSQANKEPIFEVYLLPKCGSQQLEHREWSMTQATLAAIRRSLFGSFMPDKLTILDIMNMLLSAVGIYGRAGSLVSEKDSWVPHYAALTSGLVDESGYETDDLDAMLAEECAREAPDAGFGVGDDSFWVAARQMNS
jgi:hypothetical protein